jgi:tetratricopeptide (TPR) repeat protein
VRDAAADGLLSAWLEGAAVLRAGGAYERALDRLRLAHEALGSREVYEPMAALYLEWGDALLAEGDYEAAAATYGRIRYDVPSARHWRTAEERGASAYCAWQAALRGAGDEAGAAWVCDMFADALPRMVGGCVGCGR